MSLVVNIFVFGWISVVVTGNDVCLKCNDATSPLDCDTIQLCGSHEVCYTEQYIDSQGFVRFNIGCRDKQSCGPLTVFGRRSNGLRNSDMYVRLNGVRNTGISILCEECCSGFLCNSAGCGVTGIPSKTSRGPICYNCDQQIDMARGCDRIKTCGRDQVCDNIFTQYSGRKRYNNHIEHGGQCNLQCCDGDLCNTGCGNITNTGALPSLTTHSPVPTTPTPTSHVPGIRSDCSEILKNKESHGDGVYTIKLYKSHYTMSVYCDMTSDGGGWTIIQNRFDGRLDFNRGFHEYKYGFGDVTRELWTGLKYTQELSAQYPTVLRVDLTAADDTTAYEKYWDFTLRGGNNYIFHSGHHTGTAGGGLVNDMAFTTKDRDLDASTTNCAVYEHGGGWYHDCAGANLNGQYRTPGMHNNPNGGIFYYNWKKYDTLKATRIMIRPQ